MNTLGTSANYLPDYGFFLSPLEEDQGEGNSWVEYEPDSELRDTENAPLKDNIHAYFLREVRPHVADAWLNIDKTQIGYEISSNKYFYQHTRFALWKE